MSLWRRKALEQLPECKQLIDSASNPMALWIDLQFACEKATSEGKEDLVGRFYSYAHSCWKSPSADVRTAVACAFYEHLPTSPVLKRDMPRRFGRTVFLELREIFLHHLSADDAVIFEKEFFSKEQKFVKEVL